MKWARESLAYCKQNLMSGSGRISGNQNAHRCGVDKAYAHDVSGGRKRKMGSEAITLHL